MRDALNFLTLARWFVLRQWRLKPWRCLAVAVGVAVGAAVFLAVRLSVQASVDAYRLSMDAFTGQAELTVVSPGSRVPGRLTADLLRHPAVERASPVVSAYVRDATGKPTLLLGLDPILDRHFRPFALLAQSEGPGPAAWMDLLALPGSALIGKELADRLGVSTGDRVLVSHMGRQAAFTVLGLLDPDGPASGTVSARGSGSSSGKASGGVSGSAPGRTSGDASGSAASSASGNSSEGSSANTAGNAAKRTAGGSPSRPARPERGANLAGIEAGNILLVDMATAQEFLELGGLVDRIDLKLSPGVSPESLPDSLTALLPPGVQAARPGQARESGLAMIGAYRLNLTVLSFVSLFVGMFLIYSLVSLDTASRRKELAVLRSLGASSGLVRWLFLFQGGLLGALGWAMGMPLAVAATGFMLEGVNATVNNLFVRVAVERASLDPVETLASLAVTVAVSLLAALGPAVRATAVPPREAMAIHALQTGAKARSARLWGLAGLALTLSSWPVSALPSPTGFPLPGYLSIFLLFTGLALLAPWTLAGVTRLAAPLTVLGGVPARLASGLSAAGGNRAAVSVGALATAMALFLALSTMVHSFRASFVTWLDQTVTGDLFIRPVMAELNDYRDALPDDLSRWLAARGDVEAMPYLRRYLSLNGQPIQFEATDMEMLLRLSRFTVLESLPEAESLLRSGEGLLIAEALANQTGLGLGDTLRLDVGGTTVQARVATIIRSYRTRGGEAYFDLAAFRSLGGETGVGGLRVYFLDRSGDLTAKAQALRQDILATPWGPGMEAIPGAGLHAVVTRIFDETFAITGVLLAIALGVAALGVSVTLTVRVLERSRQLSTLMAVGASRGQITAMVLWEAVYLGLAGEVAGIAGGAALSWIIIYVINKQSFGWTFAYLPDWKALALSLPLILFAVLAAGPPAVRAALSRPPAAVLRER